MQSLAQKFGDFSTQHKFGHNRLFILQSGVFSFVFMLSEVQYYLKILQYGEQVKCRR